MAWCRFPSEGQIIRRTKVVATFSKSRLPGRLTRQADPSHDERPAFGAAVWPRGVASVGDAVPDHRDRLVMHAALAGDRAERADTGVDLHRDLPLHSLRDPLVAVGRVRHIGVDPSPERRHRDVVPGGGGGIGQARKDRLDRQASASGSLHASARSWGRVTLPIPRQRSPFLATCVYPR